MYKKCGPQSFMPSNKEEDLRKSNVLKKSTWPILIRAPLGGYKDAELDTS